MEPVPELGAQPNFNQVALILKPQDISKMVDLTIGFAVLQGLEYQEAQVLPLEKGKEQVSQQLARNQAAQEAANLLERLRKREPLTKVAAQAGLPLQDSPPFTRSQGFLQQPQGELLTSTAFNYPARIRIPHTPPFSKINITFWPLRPGRNLIWTSFRRSRINWSLISGT